MYVYCIRVLRMSDDTALLRLRVARTAREFPSILTALADGRLNITGVRLLTPHLAPENADELLATAAFRSKEELRILLAERFPKGDLPTRVQSVADTGPDAETQLGLDPVESIGEFRDSDSGGGSGARPVLELASPDEPPTAHARLAPRSPGRFGLQVTVSEATHDKLNYAQALLGHAVASRDIATVLDRALDALVEKLERRKFAKCVCSRPRKGSPKGRCVAAEIRRTVWQRDAGQCTFVSDAGKRCDAHDRLEFDHIVPVAKGGQATSSNLRLRCRTHNQYTADRQFGSGFMQTKREQAQERNQKKRAASATTTSAPTPVAPELDVTPWLRRLGYKDAEIRQRAERCAAMTNATLEQRVVAALRGP